MSGLLKRMRRRPTPEGGAVRFRFTAPTAPTRPKPPAAPAALTAPTDVRVLVAVGPDDQLVGHLDYRLCAVCRSGFISNIAVATHWQGRGVGREALSLLLACAPGYSWGTSRQSAQGRGFFGAMRAETGVDFTDRAEPCGHAVPR
ncbi:GNAT family N-acetyltransferase [Streptomyces cavernicola]|uniref:N-acetyltransferase domain-containing protein n=1 Tax=Streptomyces cavernicola TaxID=3043613 RepID=A0ABT6SQ50_9ACTN|nr:GNAT family N-acetyltransferase [Streptomyces sp. B-S-A6]MDI3409361.1 hypothetical protein [Streptomyces sp. B-S-A6]